jgi:excisionase family DNA binding protein
LTDRGGHAIVLGNFSRSKDEEEDLEKEVMTAAELADYLSFSKNWVYRKAEAGEIPGVKLGNRWRFKKTVIDKWLEKRIAAEERGEAGEF